MSKRERTLDLSSHLLTFPLSHPLMQSYPSAMLYFDHNATTPVMPAARAAWLEATEKFIGNPSSPHRLGQRADAALQSAREQLAALLGCDAMDIVWTSGATESSNMVLHHVACGAPGT